MQRRTERLAMAALDSRVPAVIIPLYGSPLTPSLRNNFAFFTPLYRGLRHNPAKELWLFYLFRGVS